MTLLQSKVHALMFLRPKQVDELAALLPGCDEQISHTLHAWLACGMVRAVCLPLERPRYQLIGVQVIRLFVEVETYPAQESPQ